jgi:hypothetical protein
MAGEDDEIVVTIEGEAPPPTDEIVKLNDETQQVQKTNTAGDDDIVSSLKAQLAEKQTALDSATQRATHAEANLGQANQRARQFEQEATDARSRAEESSRNTIDHGIAAAKAESQAAEEALQSAFDAGNAKGVAEANRRLARAQSDLVLLENSKVDAPAAPERRATTAPQPSDQVEHFISQHTQRTQDWMRAHRDYVTDPQKNTKMIAAHWDAVAAGLAPDSDAYFQHVEKKVGIRKADTEAPNNGQQQQTSQRRPTAATAPVTATGGGMSGGAVEVRLSASEARAATDGTHVWNYDDPSGKGRWKKGDVLGVQEFARRKAAMTKEGRYQNISVDGT